MGSGGVIANFPWPVTGLIQRRFLRPRRAFAGGLPGCSRGGRAAAWLRLPPPAEPGYNARFIPNLEGITMKSDIHPAYTEINVACSCGNNFKTRSTLGQDLAVEVCSQCHPFYTGRQKILDTAGRVDRFNKKFGLK